MKMKTLFLGALAATVGGVSMAASPKYSEADAWRRDFRAVVDSGPSAAHQPAVMQRRLDDLLRRADGLFSKAGSQFDACIGSVQDYKGASVLPAGVVPTRLVFESGAKYWACREAIDALN